MEFREGSEADAVPRAWFEAESALSVVARARGWSTLSAVSRLRHGAAVWSPRLLTTELAVDVLQLERWTAVHVYRRIDAWRSSAEWSTNGLEDATAEKAAFDAALRPASAGVLCSDAAQFPALVRNVSAAQCRDEELGRIAGKADSAVGVSADVAIRLNERAPGHLRIADVLAAATEVFRPGLGLARPNRECCACENDVKRARPHDCPHGLPDVPEITHGLDRPPDLLRCLLGGSTTVLPHRAPTLRIIARRTQCGRRRPLPV
jgi:hypothetical protein